MVQFLARAINLVSKVSRQNLRPTQHFILWIPLLISLGAQRPEREAKYLLHLVPRLITSGAITALLHMPYGVDKDLCTVFTALHFIYCTLLDFDFTFLNFIFL